MTVMQCVALTSKMWRESVLRSCVSGSYSTTLSLASGNDMTNVSRTDPGSVTISNPMIVPLRVNEAMHSNLIFGGRTAWPRLSTDSEAASASSGTRRNTFKMLAPAMTRFFSPYPKKFAYRVCSTPVGGCGVRTMENILKFEEMNNFSNLKSKLTIFK